MIKKIKSEKGESIGEVLVAMLVVALGSVMFASMVSVSGNLITRSKQAYHIYIDNHNQLESESINAQNRKVKIETESDLDFSKNESNDCEIGNVEEPVKVYVSSDQKRYTYEYNPDVTGADGQ